MKKQWIVMLTLVLMALLAFIFVTEQRRFASTQPVRLLAVEQANTILITLPGESNQPSMELQKQQDLWKLIEPSKAKVNQDRITPLLSLLTLPDSTAYPVADVDLEELGLLSPHATIQINELTFVFGGPGPGELQRYLMIDEHVYLTRDILLPLIAGGVASITTPAE